jgi:hypothetical protein
MIIFAREHLTDSLIAEAMPLLEAHHKEIAWQGVPLDVNFEEYKAVGAAGFLRVYTARENGELAGYAGFYVRHHPHSRQTIQALADIIYITPTKRGFGKKFILWIDSQLFAEGVSVIYHSVTTKFDFSHLLERMGYTIDSTLYVRRLNDGSSSSDTPLGSRRCGSSRHSDASNILEQSEQRSKESGL